eukprot:UN05555
MRIFDQESQLAPTLSFDYLIDSLAQKANFSCQNCCRLLFSFTPK